jgi:hypothetical protein
VPPYHPQSRSTTLYRKTDFAEDDFTKTLNDLLLDEEYDGD